MLEEQESLFLPQLFGEPYEHHNIAVLGQTEQLLEGVEKSNSDYLEKRLKNDAGRVCKLICNKINNTMPTQKEKTNKIPQQTNTIINAPPATIADKNETMEISKAPGPTNFQGGSRQSIDEEDGNVSTKAASQTSALSINNMQQFNPSGSEQSPKENVLFWLEGTSSQCSILDSDEQCILGGS